ncbi:hypothetical protein ACFQ0Q_50405 [Streptomyces aureus]|uniref:hypothetical protein n=1 Tax=Streptomyces aureus TaxID=193461 RepID=UPI00338573B1
MAVTRDGIPVRVWSWPGNTGDQKLIRQVKDDMRDWTLSKVVWITDRGFSSERNRRCLRQGDNAYIVGEKLHSGSPEVKAACPGRAASPPSPSPRPTSWPSSASRPRSRSSRSSPHPADQHERQRPEKRLSGALIHVHAGQTPDSRL